jgi:hypothetical protein
MNPRPQPPTWRELHPADDPAVEARQLAAWRAATPAEGLARTGQLMLALRQLAAATIRRSETQLSDDELRQRLAWQWLGLAVAPGRR